MFCSLVGVGGLGETWGLPTARLARFGCQAWEIKLIQVFFNDYVASALPKAGSGCEQDSHRSSGRILELKYRVITADQSYIFHVGKDFNSIITRKQRVPS